MKKHYLILTAITVLALATISCGIQFVGSNPTPVPQQPIPQNFNPQLQGPDNVNSGPQNQGPGPNPGGGNPGEGDILLFTADQMTLKKGDCTNLHWETRGGFEARLNGQPVQAVGQQQICPTQTTVYGLGLDTGNQMLTREVTITVSGGNQALQINPTKPPKKNPVGGNKTATNTPPSPFGGTNLQIRTVDVGISNIYPAANGHIMATIQNNGNDTISTNITLSCSGTVTYKGTNSSPDVTGQLGPYTQNFGFKLGAGEKFDQDTQIARDPTVKKLIVTCSITPPAHDSDNTNDSRGPVQVK